MFLGMATPLDQDASAAVQLTEQAGRQLGGFDCEFIERPPEAIQVDCPICLSVLREPHQVTCCGYSYCRSCIERIQLQKSSCPTCNATDFSVFPNKGLERSLYAFKVRCSHKKEGCQWTGELRELDKHLNTNPKLGDACEFARIACCYCSELYQRRYITAHQTKECLHRPFICHYCGDYRAGFEDVMTKHWPLCEFYPISCPNECGVCPERQNLEHHVSKDCPLAVVNCDFHYAGCEVQLPRKDMPAHLAEDLVFHMSLMAVQNRKREEEITELKDKLAENTRKIETLERENEALKKSLAQKTKKIERKLEPVLTSLPVEFTMTDFEQHTRNKEVWYSPPFYTHPQGYKLCLRVDPHSSSSDCIVIGVHLMLGEFDHVLKWPFEGSIAFEIVNQLQDSGHYRLTAVFAGTQCACRVTYGGLAEEGEDGFVPDHKLGYDASNNCHYLRSDSLRIRVTQIVNQDVLQLQRRCLAIESRVCLCPIEFTMTDFEIFKQARGRWFSPSFYTHTRSYRICFEVSGRKVACNSHIGVFVHLMQGEFDNSLKWPFRGDITIQLLNQLQNKGHYEKTLEFTDTTPVVITGRVTAWTMNTGGGYYDFVSYDKLAYDQATNCQYLYNDCLRFRVTAKMKRLPK